MKLRNKRTRGLANCEPIEVKTDAGFHDYYSLAELNEEWEDYKPAEPLFTKEVAHMFLLWAEINELSVVSCMYICDGTACFMGRKAIDKRDVMIDIPRTYMSDRITVGTEYTIPELCGEEDK